MTCLKQFYQLWLCTKITRVSILIVISLITSFSMTTVTSNTYASALAIIPWNTLGLMTRCPLNAYTSAMILPLRSFISLGGVSKSLLAVSWTLCSWDTTKEKNHTWVSQGALVATLIDAVTLWLKGFPQSFFNNYSLRGKNSPGQLATLIYWLQNVPCLSLVFRSV